MSASPASRPRLGGRAARRPDLLDAQVVVGVEDPPPPRPAVERLDRVQVLAHRVHVQPGGDLGGDEVAQHEIVELLRRATSERLQRA
jgi:hypothetical protein